MSVQFGLKEFGEMIRSARKRAGQKQHELGARLGFAGGQFISNLERGLQPLPPRHVPKLAHALNLDQDDIINALVRVQALKIRNKSKNL